MTNKKNVAQQLSDAFNTNSNVHVIPTKAAKVVKEMEKQIENLFSELVKSKKEISCLKDLVDYQRDRITALEEQLNTLKTKEKSENTNKNKDLAAPKKSKKKTKKSGQVKQAKKSTKKA